MIEAREERYLRYRFGVDDEKEHPLTETAKRFHLSESRAKKTEAQALDNVWLELPWWYEQHPTFLLASIIEAWIAISKEIDEMNIRKPPVLANIRLSTAVGKGLSGTVTDRPFPAAAVAKGITH